MSERTVNPQDSVDLVLLLQSYGATLGTLYVRAYVYNDSDVEITGSPFVLSHVANNLYTLKNAFQVGGSGTYKVIYLVYTDSGYTTRSAEHGEIVDVINVKIQSTTGLGGYGSMRNGADVIVDMDPIFKAIKDLKKQVDKKLKKLQSDFNAGLKVSVPDVDLSGILGKLTSIEGSLPNDKNFNNIIKEIDSIKISQRNSAQETLKAIKKNRSTIIKSKFDKAVIKPVLQTVADSDLKLVRGLRELKIDLTKTIDMKNDQARKDLVKDNLNALNELNESIRQKLKYFLDALSPALSVLMGGRKLKNDINITLKKNE